MKAFVIKAKFYLLEASATHDKVARSISSLVMFQYFYTRQRTILLCRADFVKLPPSDQSQLYLKINPDHSTTTILQLPIQKLKVLLWNIYPVYDDA